MNGAGLFSRGIDPLASDRTTAFSSIKPICSALMGRPVVNANSYKEILSNLLQLQESLNSLHITLRPTTFNPSLINYAAFPLTHLLQRNQPQTLPERILEALFGCLVFLFERWKECEGGVDLRAWEEMWVVTVIVLGGSLGGSAPGQADPARGGRTSETSARDGDSKGKGRELAEETQMTGMAFLHTLLDSRQDIALMEGDFGYSNGQAHPSSEMISAIFSGEQAYRRSGEPSSQTPKRSLLPILFHTINTLLTISSPPGSSNPDLRCSALRLLRTLITTYLQDKPEILATLLPGITSTFVRAIVDETKSKGLNGDVGREICGLLADITVLTLGDDMLVDTGVVRDQASSLEELNGMGPNNAAHAESKVDKATPPERSPGRANFPPLTEQYLAFTSTQLHTAFRTILAPLLDAHSGLVRLSAIDMAIRILRACAGSLASSRDILIRAVLRCTLDGMPDVREAAASGIHDLLARSDHQGYFQAILLNDLVRLPSLILSHDEGKLRNAMAVVTAIASTSVVSAIWRSVLSTTAGADKWTWPLLVALELGSQGNERAPSGYNRDRPAARASRIADYAGGIPLQLGPGILAETLDDSRIPTFPLATFRHMESQESVNAVSRMLEAIGRAADQYIYSVLEHLIAIVRSKYAGRDIARAVTSLWVLERMLSGMSKTTMDKAERRRLRKMAGNIVATVVSMSEEDFEEDQMDQEDTREEATGSTALVERSKGVRAVSNLLARPSHTSQSAQKETRRLVWKQQRELLSLCSLSLVATCSELLSSAFRPLLSSSLYFVLSHLGSQSQLEADFAGIALHRIAYHSGYATAQNLLLDNIDYVINAVSQRMTFKRLSPSAPAVLIAMITLAGEAIVPLVQDVVDDIFEVLDDYHGYGALVYTYLAVLDALLEAMAKDSELSGWKPKESTSGGTRAGPDPEVDFEKLGDWYKARASVAAATLEEMLEPMPTKPWGKDASATMETEDAPPPPEGVQQDVEIPPTRTQEVCTDVLNKAAFYLTHSSAVIRARVLFLMTSGIPVLMIGERESDVLPIIHRAWPYLVNRLKDAEPFVVLEAAGLVSCLARWAGDFMSRRILEDAWPILKDLLASQRHLDAASALAKRDGLHNSEVNPFTVSHRLHLSILTTMRYVAEDVPISDGLLWEMVLLFRPFLDNRVEQELQQSAVMMYRVIAKRDEDAVWLALKATVGLLDEESCRYLVERGLRIMDNMDAILT